MKKYRRLSRSIRGFTLVELLLVMAVVGILTTMGAGTYRDYATTKRVSVAADEVASLINVAKTRAISQVKPLACGAAELDGYQVVTCPGVGCSANNNTYRLEAFCSGAGQQVGPTYKLPLNVTFSPTTQQTILFRTISGAAEATRDIQVISDGKAKTISVSKAGLIAMTGLAPVVPAAGAPTLNFAPDLPSSVSWGDSVTITWTSTNADNCTASDGWAGTNKAPNNLVGEVVGPLTATTYTFTLACTGSTTTAPQSKIVTVLSPTTPLITDFHAQDPIIPSTNTGTTLHWTTTGSITSCTASDGSGAWTGSQSFPSGDFDTRVLASTTTYTLTCTGPVSPSAVRQYTVTVSATAPTPTPTPVPSLTFKANSVIPSGALINLSWTSLNLASCLGNSVPGDSTWATHATSLGGSHMTPALTTNTTYTLTCIGAGGGSVSASAMQTIIPGTDKVVFASPSTLTPDSVTGWKDTCIRIFSGTAGTLNGIGMYITSGNGSYAWEVHRNLTSCSYSAGTLVASSVGSGNTVTNSIVDTKGYYNAKLSSPVVFGTNDQMVIRVNMTSGTTYRGSTSGSSDWNYNQYNVSLTPSWVLNNSFAVRLIKS